MTQWRKLLSVAVLSVSVLGAEAQQAEPTQSVSVELGGVMYAYEYPAAKYMTLIARAGLQAQYASTFYNTIFYDKPTWSLGLYPVISLESRFYYNLAKRYAAGKMTYKNSGGFVAIDIQYRIMALYQREVMSNSYLIATPYWGFRRVWHNHFLFEFGGGISVATDRWDDVDIGLAFDIRLGYLF